MEKYGQLFESVFKRKLTDLNTVGFLENLTKEHPYFSVAQFYLLSLSHKGVNGYKAQAKKTAVLFNNNHWLNFQLLEAVDNNHSPAFDKTFTEDQPVLNTTYDKVFSEEQHFAETIATAAEEKYDLIAIDEETAIEPIQEKTEIISVDQRFEEISIPMVEDKSVIIEETKQPVEEALAEPNKEENISVTEETNTPGTFEEATKQIEETLPVPEEVVSTYENTVIEEQPQPVENTLEERAEEIITPIFIQEQKQIIEETQHILAEEIKAAPVVQEEVIAVEEAQQPNTEVKEELNTPSTEENKTAEEEVISPEAMGEAKPEPANEPLLFEPLHTTDYFASVGIKLSEEEKTSGSLGKQLKSFTEWLKTMKKVHAAELAQTTNPKEVEAAGAEKSIQKLAEKSNEENDVITEAMADVLMQQGRRDKALEILEKLSLLNPGKSTYFAAKINQIKEK